MGCGIIGTWRMALEGAAAALKILENDGSAADAAETAVKIVEDYPYYKSVGYGGLPNEHGEVELDAAFMDGDSLAIGAVAGIKNYKNPISIARRLSQNQFNAFLVGAGAEEYARQNGFCKQEMLTERARKTWQKRLEEMRGKKLSAYDGHDTVGLLTLDASGSLAAATSTSGLFMKKRGRVGDSPLSGSGFYVDSEIGGASATGLGEDIMKGCLSYEIVRLMKEGLQPQCACDRALHSFARDLSRRKGKSAGAMSVVAMNKQGAWGAATNVEFSFVAGSNEENLAVYLAYPSDEGCSVIERATASWLQAYEERIKKPI